MEQATLSHRRKVAPMDGEERVPGETACLITKLRPANGPAYGTLYRALRAHGLTALQREIGRGGRRSPSQTSGRYRAPAARSARPPDGGQLRAVRSITSATSARWSKCPCVSSTISTRTPGGDRPGSPPLRFRINDGGNGRGRINHRVAVVRHRAADAGDNPRFRHGHSNR